jgi:hypothetical protein
MAVTLDEDRSATLNQIGKAKSEELRRVERAKTLLME